jgi:hypothetical protein
MWLRPVSLALLAGLTLGAPAALADSSSPQVSQVGAERISPARFHAMPAGPQSDDGAASTYAERESTHQDAAKFQGGRVAIIGATSGALLVVLILILLLV